jgi:hypothetical protein
MHGQDWLWYLESSAEDILKTTAKYFFCVLQRKKCKYVSIQKKKTLFGNVVHVQPINYGKIYCLGYSYLRNTLHGESKSLGGF